MRTRTATTLAAAVLLAALTACGSADGGTEPAPTTAASSSSTPTTATGDNDRAALENSVRDYTRALFAPDPDTGYRLLSARCKAEMPEPEFKALAEQAHHEYGALTIKTISVDQLSGDMARVSYGVGVPQFERKAQPWTREGGVWRWDAC